MDKDFLAIPILRIRTSCQYFDQAAEIYRSSSRELTDIVREIGDGKTDRAKET